MIPEILAILKELPLGAQARVKDFAAAELDRLKEKAQRRNQSRAKRNCDPDPPMYRG